jgi:hypothetical protein
MPDSAYGRTRIIDGNRSAEGRLVTPSGHSGLSGIGEIKSGRVQVTASRSS